MILWLLSSSRLKSKLGQFVCLRSAVETAEAGSVPLTMFYDAFYYFYVPYPFTASIMCTHERIDLRKIKKD